MRFKFLEILNVKYVPWNNGRGHVEQVPQCDDNLIKRINALVSNQTYFTQQSNSGATGGNSNSNPQVRQATIYYKMLKCESKLVRFLFEINGLVSTDRHDWNMLWTHTQGKNYFYERLNQNQKINHFPASQELTRKDRLAVNVKKMQDRFSR